MCPISRTNNGAVADCVVSVRDSSRLYRIYRIGTLAEVNCTVSVGQVLRQNRFVAFQ